MWVPAWETMVGGVRCLRLYEVSEIPCKSMAVFWHLFYCPGKGIPDNKKYFVGYHTLYGMEPKWNHSFFCSEEGNQADAKQTFGFNRAYIEKIYKLQSSGLGEAQGFSR